MSLKKLLIIIFCILCSVCMGFTLGYFSHDFIKNKITIIKDQASKNPDQYSIALSKREREFLISNMKKSKHYLEFGSGGSTFLALQNSDADVVSVENDGNWIKYLRKWRYIKENENKRLKFCYVYTGKVVDWGHPKDIMLDRELFPNYSKKVFEEFDNNYDLVFVDGRFRVASTLQAILNTDQNVKIIIHDFTKRQCYQEVLKFLEIEKIVDTMALLKKKQNINKQKVIEMYEKLKYDTL